MERIVHKSEKCLLTDEWKSHTIKMHSSQPQNSVDPIIEGFSMRGMIQNSIEKSFWSEALTMDLSAKVQQKEIINKAKK